MYTIDFTPESDRLHFLLKPAGTNVDTYELDLAGNLVILHDMSDHCPVGLRFSAITPTLKGLQGKLREDTEGNARLLDLLRLVHAATTRGWSDNQARELQNWKFFTAYALARTAVFNPGAILAQSQAHLDWLTGPK